MIDQEKNNIIIRYTRLLERMIQEYHKLKQ